MERRSTIIEAWLLSASGPPVHRGFERLRRISLCLRKEGSPGGSCCGWCWCGCWVGFCEWNSKGAAIGGAVHLQVGGTGEAKPFGRGGAHGQRLALRCPGGGTEQKPPETREWWSVGAYGARFWFSTRPISAALAENQGMPTFCGKQEVSMPIL